MAIKKLAKLAKPNLSSNYPAMKEVFEQKRADLPFLKIGEIINGKVIHHERGSLFLDLGILGTGVIYGQEYFDAKNHLKKIKVGDTISAKIIDLENEDGHVELSIREAGRELTWKNLLQKKESGESQEVKIIGVNRGGLITEVDGISAFMPVSQLSLEHYPKVEGGDKNKILEELRKFVGKNLSVKVIDADPKEEKLIISERAQEINKTKELLKSYKVGDIVEGEITGLVDFGAFIRFGEESLEGLIHISEMAWQLVANPKDIVKMGDVVKVKIIDISGDGKISLSMKSLQADPWQEIEKQFKKGDVVLGEVTKFNPFGAFIKLNDSIQGLCHISEFGSRKKMEEELEIGKKYKFTVLLIEPKKHKITLGVASEEKKEDTK